MSEPFRLAFLGIDHPHGSSWRELLFLNFGDEVRITAIAPGYGGATTSLEERIAGVPRFATVEELIERGEFDGAIVCLPNDAAPAAIAQLAAAGKHVLVEKPAAGSAEAARPFVEAADQANIAFQNGYTWRYDEAANRIRDMIRDRRFGKLISVEMTFVTSDVARRGPTHYLFDPAVSGGGFFNWLACHFLDLLLYVTGRAVVGVTARTGVFGDSPVDVEDGGAAILDLEGGAIATLIGGYWLPRWTGESSWCVRGSQRWLHWDCKSGSGDVLQIHGPMPQWFAMEETVTLPVDKTPGYGGRNGAALVNDWLAAARENGRPCRSTPQSTLAALELIDTIQRASREGRRIQCRIEPA